MFKDVFLSHSLHELLGIASVCVFFFIFTFRALLSLVLSRSHVDHMSQLPLNDCKEYK